MGLQTYLAQRAVRSKINQAHELLVTGTRADAERAVGVAQDALEAAAVLSARSRDRRSANIVLGHALAMVAPEDSLEHYRALSIDVRDEDGDDLDAAVLNNWASVLTQRGGFSEALRLYERAIKIKRRVYGNLSPEILPNLEDLRISAVELGDQQTEHWANEQMLAVIGSVVDRDHPEYIKARQNFAISASQLTPSVDGATPDMDVDAPDTEAEVDAIMALYESGDVAAAQLRHTGLLERRAAMLPLPPPADAILAEKTDPVLAKISEIEAAGLAAEAADDLETTVRLFAQIAAMLVPAVLQPSLGAAAQSNVSRILIRLSRFEEARAQLQMAIGSFANPLVEDRYKTAVLSTFVELIWTIAAKQAPDPASGSYELESMADRPENFTASLRIHIAQRVADETDVAFASRQLSARAVFYASVGDTARTRTLLELALELARVGALDSPETSAPAILELARHDLRHGAYGLADRGLNELAQMATDDLLDEAVELETFLARADLALRLGQKDRLAPLVDDMKRFAARPPADETIRDTIEENIAVLFLRTGEFDQARPIIAAIIDRERTSTGSATRPQRLARLASFAMALGEYDDAEDGFRRATAGMRESVGEWNLDYARALSNMGTLARYQRRNDEAEQCHRRATEIRKELLGNDHAQTNESRLRFVLDLVLLGRHDDAFDATVEGTVSARRIIGHASMMSAETSLLGSVKRHRTWLDIGLTLLARTTARHATGQMFDCVLRQKRLTNVALITRRNAALSGRYPGLADKLRELDKLQVLLASATLSGSQSKSTLEEARTRRDALEIEVMRGVPEVGRETGEQVVSARDVGSALPAGSVLAEFVVFEEQDFEHVVADPTSDDLSGGDRYGLFLLSAGMDGVPEFLDLGPSAEIDEDVRAVVAAMAGAAPPPNAQASLVASVCDPILAFARKKNADRIFLAGDGDVSMLAFDALPMENGQPLLFDFEVIHLGTGRDLLKSLDTDRRLQSQPVAVIDPDYGARIMPQDDEGDPASRGIKVNFSRLPGTRVEGASISALYPSTEVFEGAAATVGALMGVRQPAFLHLATHGFFIPGVGGAAVLDPMLRSALAFAGANITPTSDAEEYAAGLLTAAAVATLDLSGCSLVVLSACESGLGEATDGEGVFGLRRAFAIAGAHTVVVSLWKIPDLATSTLMSHFYKSLAAGEAKPAALRSAKKIMYEAHHPARDWAGFICEGAWGEL